MQESTRCLTILETRSNQTKWKASSENQQNSTRSAQINRKNSNLIKMGYLLLLTQPLTKESNFTKKNAQVEKNSLEQSVLFCCHLPKMSQLSRAIFKINDNEPFWLPVFGKDPFFGFTWLTLLDLNQYNGQCIKCTPAASLFTLPQLLNSLIYQVLLFQHL